MPAWDLAFRRELDDKRQEIPISPGARLGKSYYSRHPEQILNSLWWPGNNVIDCDL